MIDLFLPDADSTFVVGTAIGRLVRPGDVLAVYGDLGAGKTTLAQGVARGLDVPDDHYVNSPTFAILQIHPGRVAFNHMDLYRLADIDEAYGIGLDEVVASDGVSYIEWPSRVPELIPVEHIRIELTHLENGRRLYIEAHGARYRDFLDSCAKLNAVDGEFGAK